MKKYLKQILASAMYCAGLPAFAGWIRCRLTGQGEFVILMYHRVLDDPYSPEEYTQPAISVSVKTFERQMQHLAKNYRIVPLSRIIEMLRKGVPLPKNCAAITFDDGWRDNYTHAYPILKKHNLPATIFLTTDYIGRNRRFWFLKLGFLLAEGHLSAKELADAYLCVQDTRNSAGAPSRGEIETAAEDRDQFINLVKRSDVQSITRLLDELERRTGLSEDKWPDRQWTLSWDDVAAMDASIIEYGSHGRSHRIILSLTDQEVRDELVESKKIIESRLGRQIVSFAYPNGDYNDATIRLVQEAGYACAITTHGAKRSRADLDLYALRRVGLHEGATEGPSGEFSEAIFACILAGII